jgi:S1-C subfamily serine protease
MTLTRRTRRAARERGQLQVQLGSDPQPRPARLVGAYPAGDLAVIQAEDSTGFKPASFRDSDKAQAGDVVLAVGNPLGLASSVTEGIVSATGRAVTEPASPGSAGTVLPGAASVVPLGTPSQALHDGFTQPAPGWTQLGRRQRGPQTPMWRSPAFGGHR